MLLKSRRSLFHKNYWMDNNFHLILTPEFLIMPFCFLVGKRNSAFLVILFGLNFGMRGYYQGRSGVCARSPILLAGVDLYTCA